MTFGNGISHVGEVVDLGAEDDIITKSGAWYSYGTERIGQGREAAKMYLSEHPDLMNEIEAKIREKRS